MKTHSLTAFPAETTTGDLIRIIHEGSKLTASARELYRFLELDPGSFARWAKQNITENPAASESDDWIATLHDAETPTGGKLEREDYALSIAFAKELAMMARSAKGKQAREYFLACERKLQQQIVPVLAVPQTYAAALRALADTVEEKERLALTNAALVPKAEFFDAVADSKDAIEMGAVAKVLDFPGVGRTKLFARLRERKILRKDNSPYQEYIDRGYFRLIEQKWSTPDGETHISLKTLCFQKGLDFIRQMLAGDVQN